MSAREPIILFRVLGGAAAAFRSIARRRRAQGDQGAQLLGASPPGVAIGRGARRAGARCSACSREHGEGGGGADGAVDLVDGGSMEVYVQRAVEQWLRVWLMCWALPAAALRYRSTSCRDVCRVDAMCAHCALSRGPHAARPEARCRVPASAPVRCPVRWCGVRRGVSGPFAARQPAPPPATAPRTSRRGDTIDSLASAFSAIAHRP